MDERALVKKLNRGSRSALDTAVERFTPYVSAVILRPLAGRACREDVEELCADVFVALWSHAHQLDPEQGLRPWLAAVARNKAKNRLRRREQTLPLEEDILDLPGPDDPAGALEQKEEQALVRRALLTLPQPDQEIFLRHYYYAQGVKEIAAALDMNESTVKTRLRRGRFKLKELLTKEALA